MMNLTDVITLIKKGEGLKLEFKEAKGSVPASFYETVVAFANTDGGTVLFGIDDDGEVTGVQPDLSLKIQKDIVTALNSRDCIDPPMHIQPYSVNHPLGEIIVIQIPVSSLVHDHAGRIYIRRYESDIDITGNQQLVGDLYLRKRNFFTEAEIIPHLTMNDLDLALFDKARQLIRNFRGDHPWLLVDNGQMLKDSVLWKKDFRTGQEGLTLAAALIFGKDETIQSLLPAYKVEAMVRIHNIDRWDDRINPPLRTNLIDTYLALKQFINKHLPEKFYLEGHQRVDLRDKIFREVIGNAIVHREYTNAHSTELIISANRVTITNPNKPLFHGLIDPKEFNPFPKNPNIRKFFTAFGWTDEIGSGIRNTYKYLPEYSGGATPLFIEDDLFRTEIPLTFNSFGSFAEEMLRWLGLPEDCLPHLKDGLTKVMLPANLKPGDWESLLLHLVPSWHKKGAQLDILNWPDNQVYIEEYIKKVPGWQHKGTQLLKKKAWYFMTILTLTTRPVKLKEMMDIIDYKNQKVFRDNYLMPLRQAGFIVFTNPEVPTDPENRYVITEDGKLFLGGMNKE